jgi:hypothetical protein
MSNTETNLSDAADVGDLHQFGYVQSLRRTLGPYGSFAIAFSMISISAAIFFLLPSLFATAGAAGVWLWIPCAAGVFVYALTVGGAIYAHQKRIMPAHRPGDFSLGPLVRARHRRGTHLRGRRHRDRAGPARRPHRSRVPAGSRGRRGAVVPALPALADRAQARGHLPPGGSGPGGVRGDDALTGYPTLRGPVARGGLRKTLCKRAADAARLLACSGSPSFPPARLTARR